MLMNPYTFLTFIKEVVTGGGRDANGNSKLDSGFLVDAPLSLADVRPEAIVSLTDNTTGTANDTLEALTSGTVYATDVAAIRNNFADLAAKVNTLISAMKGTAAETNLRVLSAPANTTAVGSIEFTVPRDYDEATDIAALRMLVASAGATDTPALTLNVYRKRAGANIATLAAAVAMSSRFGVTALSATARIAEFALSGLGLLRDDVVIIQIVSAAHTTDAVLVYSVTPVYRSCLVSYNREDTSNNALR